MTKERFLLRYGDLHCDTLTREAEGGTTFLHRTTSQISLEKLLGGGCFLQCFALFTPSDCPEPWRRAEKYFSDFAAAKEELTAAGVRPVLTIENGGNLEGDLSRLDEAERAGVKIFGFTWNDENCLGFPCGEKGGLKPFGKRTAEELFSRGIYADVSHLGDDGFEDLRRIAEGYRIPLIATHSLSRAVCAHKRNLTDGQIKAIADSGGIVGVNFVREFIGEKGIFAHIRHIARIGGEDVLAIGTDFDGTENPLYAGADEMPGFFEDMKKAGFCFRVTEKLAYKNAKRILTN